MKSMIHLRKDKTKSILFGSSRRLKDTHKLDIQNEDIVIRKHAEVKYQGCIFDCNLKELFKAKYLHRKRDVLNGF